MNAIVKPFPERLENGKVFEDFVALKLYELGWPIVIFHSRAFQWRCGESVSRVEIKNDTRWQGTGNIFIETKERRDETGQSRWRASGIYDASDPWFYVVGSEIKFWIFSTRLLRILEKRYERKPTGTAEGFIVPIVDADKYCAFSIPPP